MTNSRTYTSRRDRRRAARKTLVRANAASAGRTSAAVLAASGLMLSTGAAANASQGSSGDRTSSTVELPVSELTIERASQNDAVTVANTTDVELSFDRPDLTSEPSPERVAAEEGADGEAEAAAEAQAQQEAEAAAAAQAEQEAQAEAQARQAAEAQAEQEAEAAAEAQAAQEAQAQAAQEAAAEAEVAAEAEAQAEREAAAEAQEQAQPAQQTQSEPAQQDSGQSSPPDSGATTAGETEQPSASDGGNNGSVVSAAQSAVGSSYSYGGTSPAGFDCSGLINWAYNQAGQGGLPRTTHGMASLPQVSSPQPGDIVLSNGNSHGAIYIGNGQVISATTSGGVRVHGLNESWHQVTTIHRPS